METTVALEMCIDMNDTSAFEVYIDIIISDDAIMMHTHMQHGSGGGKLPDHIPTASFLDYPSHLIKVMVLSIFKLAVHKSNDPKRCRTILFNCHGWCSLAWCWTKQLDENALELATAHTQKYIINWTTNLTPHLHLGKLLS